MVSGHYARMDVTLGKGEAVDDMDEELAMLVMIDIMCHKEADHFMTLLSELVTGFKDSPGRL